MSGDAVVSVIVPVYNVERYISKCLDSLCRQKYENIEVIVVDDSSPDESAKIVREYMEKDSRIRYIKRENGGLGAARNTGMKVSTGEYICFVDSDDWVSSDYVSRFMETLEKDKSDVVIANIRYVFPDGTERLRTPHIDEHEIISGKEALSREFIGKQYRCHAPNKFCRRSLFVDNGIWFPEGKLYEDVFTTYKILLAATQVSVIPEYTYFYLQNRSGSIMNTEIKLQRFTDMFEALDLILSNERCRSYQLDAEIQCLYVENIISLVNYIYPLIGSVPVRNIQKYKGRIAEDKNYHMLTKGILSNRTISRASKIRAIMIRYSFVLYCFLMHFIKTKM